MKDAVLFVQLLRVRGDNQL